MEDNSLVDLCSTSCVHLTNLFHTASWCVQSYSAHGRHWCAVPSDTCRSFAGIGPEMARADRTCLPHTFSTPHSLPSSLHHLRHLCRDQARDGHRWDLPKIRPADRAQCPTPSLPHSHFLRTRFANNLLYHLIPCKIHLRIRNINSL